MANFMKILSEILDLLLYASRPTDRYETNRCVSGLVVVNAQRVTFQFTHVNIKYLYIAHANRWRYQFV